MKSHGNKFSPALLKVRGQPYLWVNAELEVHRHCIPGMINGKSILTHWGRVTHIFISKSTIIGSDNGLSPGRHQDIIWTNTGMLLTGPMRINFSEILIEIYTFSFKKMQLKCAPTHLRILSPLAPLWTSIIKGKCVLTTDPTCQFSETFIAFRD